MTTKFRARFDGRVLIPVESVDLPPGEVLDVEASRAASSADSDSGSPQAILRLMRSLRPIPVEDTDELLRVIEEGQAPAGDEAIFGDGKD